MNRTTNPIPKRTKPSGTGSTDCARYRVATTTTPLNEVVVAAASRGRDSGFIDLFKRRGTTFDHANRSTFSRYGCAERHFVAAFADLGELPETIY
jgi:hypothetical protein